MAKEFPAEFDDDDMNAVADSEGMDPSSEYEEWYEELYGKEPADDDSVDPIEEEAQRRKKEDETFSKYEYYDKVELDEDGVEVGWDPMFGSGNPIDNMAIVSPIESYMVADETRDDSMLEPIFREVNDPEIVFNDDVKQIRKDLKLVETYKDPWTEKEAPRNVKRWYGEKGEFDSYEEKDFMNNRFTKPEDKTDFTKFDPYRARRTAVQMARSKNNEWLPNGYAQKIISDKTKNFRRLNLIVGSLQRGECNPDVVEKIQPALRVLGGVVDLLSIQEGVFRFHYFGLLKNKRGMATWTETMIRDCGVECTGVVFETGNRLVDPRDNVFKGFNPRS
eukprot:CAMPEP_0195524568 /NCGR_PEP_ID=MMETSP0794_2-20130614/24476_1 /TAXON_ID=515487 /ORGANISM="Stephanopyxis turris, Strain CCMP 815" /LENGTH=333 /DNA_ID=CAMNT_0040654819 /DNA_START=321 /DNA_END=1322 /DNA_ORIENTATION=+